MSDAPLRDADARAAALDPTRSFVVQAPAGSGKTGLLIQRYLALLATVRQPESIVAMTFTRKAATEIRERITEALRAAAEEIEPTDEYAAATWQLARRVLIRDVAQGWHLREHPARLRVMTIDALASALVRQAPLATRQGSVPKAIERAEGLYERAALDALRAAAPDDPAWRSVLRHLDNDASRAVALFTQMLSRRDQWTPFLQKDDRESLRGVLERALAVEVERALAPLPGLFPGEELAGLLDHLGFAVNSLCADGRSHPLAAIVMRRALPVTTTAGLEQWRALADWLLTQKGEFRLTAEAGMGFPPAGGARVTSDAGEWKKTMRALLMRLAASPRLAQALQLARQLPAANYEQADWEFVAALFDVLPRILAHLRLIFGAQRAIDFAEATRIALDALDDPATPSDLLLAMDMRIEHLLVDEFQDTSLVQGKLIRRLIAGWVADDGRTLFLVGDPMQSIYGFRQADVTLFIDAQRKRRFADVDLEPLKLARNFRSRPALVAWVNRVFSEVLADADVLAQGAVAFSAAAAIRPADASATVSIDVCHDAASESDRVIAHLDNALAGGYQQIAVLVRKRGDLDTLLPALRARGIAFTAVGLDRLLERPAMLDLLSLTHALLQPADRLAWLATLRAPWCALALPDLFRVAAEAPSAAALFHRMRQGEAIEGLSADGRTRLARFVENLAPAWERRGRASLAGWVRGTWLALGGPACVDEAIDLAASERFFALLSEHASGSDIASWHDFVDALSGVAVEPDVQDSARVQIMTLHRAKGLEFDVVVMPGLARFPRGADAQMLLWRQREHGLLLAPLKGRTTFGSDAPLYKYVKSINAAEERAELGRLLYVGCTRARERLHLSATLSAEQKNGGALRWRRPARSTSLGLLWNVVAPAVPPPMAASMGTDAPVRLPVRLSRLVYDWRPPAPVLPVLSRAASAEDTREPIVFDWVRERARQIGVAAHDLLRRIADDGIAQWNAERVRGEHARVERECLSMGLAPAEAKNAADLVVDAAVALLDDARGRWLFDLRHGAPQSELALTGLLDGAWAHIVVDRTFVDSEGTRWIVDFKLSRHEGADRDAFLDSENERYRPQLERYARVVRGLDARPIRLGLYFPLLHAWREWSFAG
jgi:ATP-dependent exoDNAse (exonuclease V) beta subunit